MTLAPILSPHGVLSLKPSQETMAALDSERAGRLEQAFARGAGHGLLHLGANEVGAALPPVLSWWRELGTRYVTALCALPGLGDARRKPSVPSPPDDELDRLATGVPPMTGAEYLTAPVLAGLWRETDRAFDAELAEAGVALQDFLKARHPAWNLVGRVYFNLAENRKDAESPFAFLASYAPRLTAQARAQHLPLGRALQEYAGAKNRECLLSLLTPVQQASERVAWLKDMVASGAIYHPLRWSPQQALQFLKDVPALETAGVIVRMPASWRMGRPSHVRIAWRRPERVDRGCRAGLGGRLRAGLRQRAAGRRRGGAVRPGNGRRGEFRGLCFRQAETGSSHEEGRSGKEAGCAIAGGVGRRRRGIEGNARQDYRAHAKAGSGCSLRRRSHKGLVPLVARL